jgi:hypothetical protein
MPRKITGADGITWSCIQAFAGLGNDLIKTDVSRVDGMADCFHAAIRSALD